jgi:hypothetical protein
VYYPKYYPLLGLQYYMLAKLYWYFEDSKNSLFYLKKSYDILILMFDKNSNTLIQILDLFHLIQSFKKI